MNSVKRARPCRCLMRGVTLAGPLAHAEELDAVAGPFQQRQHLGQLGDQRRRPGAAAHRRTASPRRAAPRLRRARRSRSSCAAGAGRSAPGGRVRTGRCSRPRTPCRARRRSGAARTPRGSASAPAGSGSRVPGSARSRSCPAARSPGFGCARRRVRVQGCGRADSPCAILPAINRASCGQLITLPPSTFRVCAVM